MSNKQQLQTNNTALDALITRINTAKDTAASLPEAGGGSVETCTVTVNSHKGIYAYSYTAYRNGEYVAVATSDFRSSTTMSIVLDDIVCGSSFMICNSCAMNGVTVNGGVEYIGQSAVSISSRALPFKAPIISGAQATVDIWDND